MDITGNDKRAIGSIGRSAAFLSLRKLRDAMCFNLAQQKPVGDTQFDYLRDCLVREGKLAGIDAFMLEIERCATQEP